MIGIDFDNTIACYDRIFWAAARRLELIPGHVGESKTEVRDWLRQAGREDDWTWLQGHVYGACMDEVPPFAGVLEFFQAARELGCPLAVISHKTATPVRGPAYDLPGAARDWLEREGLAALLPVDGIWFEPSKAAKLARIAAAGCTIFIDDLPEFLAEPTFPAGVGKVLFDPTGRLPAPDGGLAAQSWVRLRETLLG